MRGRSSSIWASDSTIEARVRSSRKREPERQGVAPGGRAPQDLGVRRAMVRKATSGEVPGRNS